MVESFRYKFYAFYRKCGDKIDISFFKAHAFIRENNIRLAVHDIVHPIVREKPDELVPGEIDHRAPRFGYFRLKKYAFVDNIFAHTCIVS